MTQQARDGTQYDSLAYDLDTLHLGEEANNGDAASLVSDSTGRDSALGSTSIAGVEEEDEVEGARASEVIRSCSLPEQLGTLGRTRDRRDSPGKVDLFGHNCKGTSIKYVILRTTN